jgi:D-alanine-D-alanine ligase
MDRGKYEVVEYLIGKDGRWKPGPILPEPGANDGIDVVFPVLHGTFGEDGTVQGLLELADLPYVGAGVLGSSVSMDKDVMKRVCRERGLPVVEYMTLVSPHLGPEAVREKLPFPVFVKPSNLGSSVGISKARDREELEAALRMAAEYDRKVIVERAIDGRELECSVLGNSEPVASLPCEILPSREFYDYEDKYLTDGAQFRIPAELNPAQTAEVQRLAVECYRAVECEGMARVDFYQNPRQDLLNEINTIPGFTSITCSPDVGASGLAYPRLIDRLIELALERRGRKSSYAMAMLPCFLLFLLLSAAPERLESEAEIFEFYSIVEAGSDPSCRKAFYRRSRGYYGVSTRIQSS